MPFSLWEKGWDEGLGQLFIFRSFARDESRRIGIHLSHILIISFHLIAKPSPNPLPEGEGNAIP
jgi:hypothetical protein